MIVYIVYLAVFLFLGAAIFLISGLDEQIVAEHRRGKKAGAIKIRKQTPFIKLTRLKEKQRRLIEQIRMPKTVCWLLTGLGAVCGAVIGKLLFFHAFFAVAVGILGALSPQLYMDFKLTQTKSQRVEKLQASMMLLSNSYIITEDFVQSVQDNIDLLEYPALFRDFLTYVNLIDGNIKAGLRRMELQVDNPYFSQWIDALVMAQDDRSMKTVTMSVVDAMNDVHQVQMEADTAMYAIWREYFTVLALIFATPLIFHVLMKDAYLILVTTLPGQALLVLLLASVVYSLIKAVQLNRPLLM